MTEIQNSKRENDDEAQSLIQEANELNFFSSILENQNDLNLKSKPVLVIEYCNLRFICNLLARRLSGGVLVICYFSSWRLCIGFCIKCKEMTIKRLLSVKPLPHRLHSEGAAEG